jgi:hypothetical protein
MYVFIKFFLTRLSIDVVIDSNFTFCFMYIHYMFIRFFQDPSCYPYNKSCSLKNDWFKCNVIFL